MKRTESQSPVGEGEEKPDVETAQARALRIASVVQAKQAEEIVVLNVGGLTALADFFVICSAASEPQIQAIVSAVQAAYPGLRPMMEGAKGSPWVLMDYSDVILHIFKPEARTFYDLDRLWGDAPHIAVQVSPSPVRSKPRRSGVPTGGLARGGPR